MEVKRTVRVKLDVPDERRADLHATIRQFNDAANYTVEYGRNDDGYLILHKSSIHDIVYSDLRERRDLPANLCIRRLLVLAERPVSQITRQRSRYRCYLLFLIYARAGRGMWYALGRAQDVGLIGNIGNTPWLTDR